MTDTHKSMYALIKDENGWKNTEKIYYYGRRIYMKEVLAAIDGVSGYLASKGIKKGDSVGICLPNIPQAIICFYAVNKIGAIANVMHPRTGAGALREIVEKTDTKAVILLDRFAKAHIPYLKEMKIPVLVCRMSYYMPGLKRLFRLTEPCFRGADVDFYGKVLRFPAAEEFMGDGAEPAVYLHSSGTTGRPKTVVLNSRAFNAMICGTCEKLKEIRPLSETAGILMVLPIFHGFGLGLCMHMGIHFARVVLVPIFRGKSTVKLMRKEEVNVICGVPGMFRKIAAQKKFEGECVRNLQLLFCGGDRLDPKVMEGFDKTVKANGGTAVLMQGYGLSEVTSVATINTEEPFNGSAGKPIPGVDIRIIKDGKDLPDGEVGEIYVSSPSAMSGYLGGEKIDIIDENGKKWLASGDLGYLKDGFLYFRERLNRVLKIGGINIYPVEIEDTALHFEHVRQACAVRTTYNGRPAVKLLIVTDGAEFDDGFRNGLAKFIETKLISYAVPRIIEAVDSIRTNLIGKADYKYYEGNGQEGGAR